MDFKVVFRTKSGKLLESLGKPGLDILDLIRSEKEEYANVSAENINFDGSCPIHGDEVTVRLTEAQARISEYFKGKTTIVVTVPEESFYMFVDLSVQEYWASEYFPLIKLFGTGLFGKNRNTHINLLSVEYKFDKETLISSWIKAGCPIEWDPRVCK